MLQQVFGVQYNKAIQKSGIEGTVSYNGSQNVSPQCFQTVAGPSIGHKNLGPVQRAGPGIEMVPASTSPS